MQFYPCVMFQLLCSNWAILLLLAGCHHQIQDFPPLSWPVILNVYEANVPVATQVSVFFLFCTGLCICGFVVLDSLHIVCPLLAPETPCAIFCSMLGAFFVLFRGLLVLAMEATPRQYGKRLFSGHSSCSSWLVSSVHSLFIYFTNGVLASAVKWVLYYPDMLCSNYFLAIFIQVSGF